MSLKSDPVNQVGLKFEEWSPKIILYATLQNKPSTVELLKISTLDIPIGRSSHVNSSCACTYVVKKDPIIMHVYM